MEKYTPEQSNAAQSVQHLTRSSLTLKLGQHLPKRSMSSAKTLVANVCYSRSWHIFMVLIIVFNSILVVGQTDARARGDDIPAWQDHSASVMLLLFVLETVARVYVERQRYFREGFNIAEFVILSVDVALEIYSWVVKISMSVAYFRLLRIVRFFRILRMLSGFRELFMMLHGMQSAMRAMVWSLVMVAVVVAISSIIGVEFVRTLDHSLFNDNKYRNDCYRCGQAFDSVWEAALTLMASTIAGDSWGNIAVPMMSNYPASATFFCGTFMMINLGLLNLIMAVIVDRAQEARREDEAHVLIEKRKHFKQSKSRFLALCYALDTDRNGTLSVEELKRGANESREFSDILRLMDITDDDLDSLFEFLDVDGSGHVDYTEFIRQLYKLKSVDSHTAIILMGERIAKIYDQMECQIGNLMSAASTFEGSLSRATGTIVLAHQASDLSYPMVSCARTPESSHARPLSEFGFGVGCDPGIEDPFQYENNVRQALQDRCEQCVKVIQAHLDQFQQSILAHINETPFTNSFPCDACGSEALVNQITPARTSRNNTARKCSHTSASQKLHGLNLETAQHEVCATEASAVTQLSPAHVAFISDGNRALLLL